MFKPLRDFTPILESHCPDADRSLLERMLLMTCIEFCQQTWIHTEDLPPLDAVSGQQLYDVVVPPYIDVIAIKKLRWHGGPLAERTSDTLDRAAPGWMNYPDGWPYWYHPVGKSQVRVIPAPQSDSAEAFVLTAVFKPSQTATHVWGRLHSDYQSDIVAGALSKLLRMPQKPWADIKSAAMYSADFNRGVVSAKAAALKEHTSESLTAYSVTMGV